MTISRRELVDFLLGECTTEVADRIRDALKDPGSEASRICASLQKRIADPFRVDWNRLASLEIPSDPQRVRTTISELVNTAATKERAGNLIEALELRQQSVDLAVTNLGEDDRETATYINGLARLFYSMGDYASARDTFDRALTIRVKTMGPNHSDTGFTLAGIGRVFEALGEYDTALQYHQRALAITQAEFGDDHPDTAVSHTDMGGVLQALGDYPKAREHFERALNIIEEIKGVYSDSTAIATSNLSGLLVTIGELEKAQQLAQNAVDILINVVGLEHRDTAWAMNNLAWTKQAQWNLPEARDDLHASLEILLRIEGETSLDTANCLNNLGTVEHSANNLLVAKACYSRAVAIYEWLLSNEHPCTGIAKRNLSLVLETLGEHAAAAEYATAALVGLHGLLDDLPTSAGKGSSVISRSFAIDGRCHSMSVMLAT